MMPFIPRKKDYQVTPFSNRVAVSIFFFISGFNFAAWAARIPALQRQLKLSDAQLGTVLAALPTGLMITMPLAGFVLNKFSSRHVMLVSSIVYTCLLCLLGVATNVTEAVIILFLFGASRNFFNISVNTQSIGVQALYSKSIVTTFHGIWSLAALTGAALSFLFTRLSVTIVNHFLIVAISSIVLIIIVFRFTLKTDKRSITKTKGFVMPDRPLIKLGMIGFASMVCEGTMSDWSGIYLSKVVGVHDNLITIGYIAYLSAMVSGRFAGDFLVNMVGVKKLLQMSGASIGIGFLLAISFPTLISATFGFAMIGFGVSCIMPLVFSITPKISSLGTGSAIAAISTVSYLGFLAGPPIVGYIAQAANLKWAFSVCILLSLLVNFLVIKLRIDKPDSV